MGISCKHAGYTMYYNVLQCSMFTLKCFKHLQTHELNNGKTVT